MLTAFLLGFLAVFATVAIVCAARMSFKWLKNYITERMRKKSKHKVAFADTRELVDDYLKNCTEQSEEISMDDLERMCQESPYVAADIDKETGEVSDFEGIKADLTDDNFNARMKQQNGMIIFEG